MKKNMKSCVEQVYYSEPAVLLDVNDYELINASDLSPDLRHKKTAHMSAAWSFAEKTRARVLLSDPDLSAFRCLTFSVYAINGEGGSFHIRFESDAENGGDGGYCQTLPVTRNGWNDYRLELPFLYAVGQPLGWEHIRAIVLDCAVGGQANHSHTTLCFDSFYGWNDQAPKSYVRMPELKGAALFSKSSPYAVVDRRRLPIAPDADPTVRPFESNGTLWLPMAPVAAIRAHKAVADNKAGTLSFSFRRKKYAFSTSNRFTVNGEEEQLPFFPAERNGNLFFPADYLREFFRWRQLFTDPTGVIALSNRKGIFDSRRDAVTVQQLNTELTFADPRGEDILEDLRRKISNPDKARLFLLPEEWMNLRKSVKTDPVLKALLDQLKADFGKASVCFRSAPVCEEAEQLTDSAVEELSLRLQSFAALFRMTGDKLYAHRAYAECKATTALSDWQAEASIRRATDLGFAVAVAYDWCHTAWSEGEKALIERTVLRYAMRPGVDCYNGKGSMWRLHTAISAQINRSLTAMALAFANVYPETALRILRNSLRAALPALEAFAPDGGHSEGPAGWETATVALVQLIAMLESACGKDYGLSSFCGFAAAPRFALHMETANGAWNLHNGKETPINTAVFGWFSKKFGNTAYAWLRARDLATGQKPLNVMDLLFYAPQPANAEPPHLPLDSVYRNAGIASFRSGWSNNDTFLALHGGSNHVHNGELDAGSFLLEMGGERFFRDTSGIETLPKMLRLRAEGQNTLVINPTKEPLPDQNPDGVAEIIEARSTEEHAYAVVDMTSTNDLILKGKRGVLLTNNRSVAVIQDELTLTEPATAVWSAYTKATVNCIGKRTAILEQNGKTLLCKLYGGSSAAFEAIPTEDESITRLCVRVEVKEKLKLAVACSLMTDTANRAEKLYELKPMRAWEL